MPWGRDFDIAETTRDGVVVAVTVTCNYHTCEGRRCNKWVAVGGTNSRGEDMHIDNFITILYLLLQIIIVIILLFLFFLFV